MSAPNTTHDHELIQAVEELYQDPENRDAAEGGVHPSLIAAMVGMAQTTAKKRLRTLAQNGRIQEYDGLDPDTMRWRRSYAPVE